MSDLQLAALEFTRALKKAECICVAAEIVLIILFCILL
jgi:hypothetical protein